MASIEKRGKNSYRLVVDVGYDAQGKRIKRTKTIRVEEKLTPKKLKEHLDLELAKFKMEIEAGEYIRPEKMTFGAFVEEWREKYASDHLETNTLRIYNVYLKAHILPVFGHLRMDEIKPLHIVTFLKKLSQDGSRKDGKKGGLSSSSIQMNHRILKNIFTRAVEWRLLKTNPVGSVQKPKVMYKDVAPYDEKEVETLFRKLQSAPFHWRMMITLALTTGMRRGELLALEWKHIDWKEGVIDVMQSVSASKDGMAEVKDTKTKSSKRKVALPPSVLEELREYYAFRVRQRDLIGDAWKGGDCFFVFAHPDGRAFHHERPYLWFRDFLKKNGLRYIRFHDLRHTSATLLINQGVHAKIISERLGHSNITTTMNLYGHALRSADQAAAAKFENILPFKRAKTP